MTDISVSEKLAALVTRWEAEDRAKRADEIAEFCGSLTGGKADFADVEAGLDDLADEVESLANQLEGKLTKAEAADQLRSLADSLRDLKTEMPDPDDWSIDFGDAQSAQAAAESLRDYHNTEARNP